MQNIAIDNKICVFLNHHKLIQDLYQQHSESNLESYSLKQQLFNFKPKPVAFALETSLSSKQIKNLNRKRKAETENDATLKEIFKLQPFLKEIQNNFLPPQENCEDLPRLWEEQQEFPQFRGANATNEFQITQFDKKDYIIPPKTKFLNYNIEDLPKLLLELETYDLITMDMPWQNKYIKRLKKVNTSLAYQMLDNDTLKKMPIPQLIHTNTLVVLWCTNALQHRQALEQEFLPYWNLQLVHTLKWFKINTAGELISPPKPEGFKQPYELVYIACHKDRDLLELKELTMVDFLISIPSIIHSHKPPLVEWLKKFLPSSENFKGLEIFARYLQPQFTSIGLEVLKLMDKRLYEAEGGVEMVKEN
ncbi:N(6)-adenine-specific methyltransferase METTL4 [Calliphora vicina]|uniref:N(6)-adenine-specific methyltransferase METTL4 n=1 Tax=Calliphora vicina TaxID=7373 RepID=UPI00325BF864